MSSYKYLFKTSSTEDLTSGYPEVSGQLGQDYDLYVLITYVSLAPGTQ